MKTINYKKAFLWGIVVLIIDMLVGNLLYMNPLVMNLFEKFAGHPTMRSMEYFGGISNWIMINTIFSILFIIFLIVIFLKLYASIPGTGWKKGLVFGIIVGSIKAIPEAFNQYMLFNYPTSLILVQLINTLISLNIFGIVLASIFSKFKVIVLHTSTAKEKL